MSEPITIPVDGVEIKFTLTGASVQAAADSYGLEDEGVTPRDIYFFDRFDAGAPSPRLLTAHVVLRLRGKKGKSGESTLKLRPADQERLVGDFAAGSGKFGEYKVEVDWSRAQVVAASMDAEVEKDVVKAVLADLPTRPAATSRLTLNHRWPAPGLRGRPWPRRGRRRAGGPPTRRPMWSSRPRRRPAARPRPG